jgi:hypothetical protein
MSKFKVEDRNWTDIGSDVNWQDYGGHWARKIDDTNYMVIHFDRETDSDDYYVTVSEVDLAHEWLAGAMQHADVPTDGLDEYGDKIDPEAYRLMQVWACHSYGARSEVFQATGRNVRNLIAFAKRAGR